MENEIKLGLCDDEMDKIRTIEFKNEYDKRLKCEMKKMALTSGSDVRDFFKKMVREEKKKKRIEHRKNQRKKFSRLMYRIFHFGKIHPDEYLERYYSDEKIEELFKEMKTDQSSELQNLNRKMYLTENGSWLVGEKIY